MEKSFTQLKREILAHEFSKMNDMQREAVFCVNGPLLILAGAGSGKTTVLVNRIANMIRFGNTYNSDFENEFMLDEDTEFLCDCAKNGISDEERFRALVCEERIKPWNILAITFTNKAAGELKIRLEKMLGERDAAAVNSGTFHSVCVRILRQHIGLLGYDTSFTIYDTDDQKRILKDVYGTVGADEKFLPVKSVLSEISRAKDQLKTPAMYRSEAGGDYRRLLIAKLYDAYQNRLVNANAVDFDDIIMNTVRLLRENEEVLKYYQERFRYILVDEYQDTNIAQYELVRILAMKYRNICVVGDDDQSIYKFRGATIENILSFEKNYPDSVVIRLEQNYRSTQNILSAANAVIGNNIMRKGKKLWTGVGDGEKIHFFRGNTDFEEASFIVKTVEQNVLHGEKYSSHAVLYRMGSQSRNIETAFVKSGVPYRIIGGHKFYDRKEIKDILAYLQLVNNNSDTLRLRRIINEPKRKIGEATVTSVVSLAADEGVTPFHVVCHADEYPDLARSAKQLTAFGELINSLCDTARDGKLGELITRVITETGYMAMLRAMGDEGLAKIDNVNELLSNVVKYEEDNEEATLSGYLEEISLLSDIDNYDADADCAVMMTLHAAKGLEFDNVFIVGMEDGIFPSVQSIYEPGELEEERRLAYVGITRAKKRLFITTAESRMINGRTQYNPVSRFFKEIPEKLVEKTDTTYSARRQTKGSASVAPVSYHRQTNSFGGSLPESAHKQTPFSTPASLTYSVGDTVSHKIFGTGVVLSMTQMGNDVLVECDFSKVGKKKIMANFAHLTKTK